MMKGSVKEKIDIELNELTFNDTMKNNVIKYEKRKKHSSVMKYAAAFAAIFILSGTTAFAGYILLNKMNVNESTLPELDNMEVVTVSPLNTAADEYGMVNETFTDYDMVRKEMGVDLLDSELAQNNVYMQGEIETDNKDFAIITIKNYILGDTSNYEYLPSEERYQYEHGQEYYSPISLSMDIILSETQLKNGWDTDYLGLYEYVETYTSEQGYTVNLIQDTIDEENVDVENYISKKCAVFVADGVRYTLRGRTSIENMKMIVDTMK